MSNLWSKAVRNRKISMRANASPRHTRLPVVQRYVVIYVYGPQVWRYNEIVYNIANPFSLYLVFRAGYFTQGSSPISTSFFQTDNFITNSSSILFQFWYQYIKKTYIYHIIGNFPQNCHRNTRKTDKAYDFFQSAKLTCVDDFWTQTLRPISQSPLATSVRHHLLTSFGRIIAEQEGISIFWVQRSSTQVNFVDLKKS